MIKVVEYFGYQTRIKVSEYADGRKTYSPQERFLFWWLTMSCSGYSGDEPIICSTLEEAKSVIDHVISNSLSSRKTSVTYIKYP